MTSNENYVLLHPLLQKISSAKQKYSAHVTVGAPAINVSSKYVYAGRLELHTSLS
jgi:hypothetical protein